ncbi:hypothetical protein F2Q69_00052578 [Brassica cretica]|uniref:Post-GPI attachment to proteins factor 3 n=1 Tax=Brassica cretica TaxID=69181 RepID=A0A8S9MSV3_BRACR|nr:hypothetical protein F2Q69_00052578 [Brassica cretica]
MVNSWEPLYSGVHRDQSKNKSDYGWYTTKFKIDDGDLKNKGGKPTVRVSNVGHALHDPASVTFSVLSLAMHFHGWLSLDVDITKRLDYSSTIAVLGFSLIVSILRTFDVRVEAARVMVSAPVLALVTTHAAVSRHPSNWKLWVVVIASGLAMLLEIYDFPPYGGYFDAHSIWNLATVPLTILWWSFIRDDPEFRTSSLLKKSKTKVK